MGGLFNSGAKAAREQAKAMKEQAEQQAYNDRLMAQAAQNARETVLNQDKAAAAAAELTDKPVDKVDVQVGEDVPAAEIDPSTGRRRTVRSSFQLNRKTSGLNLS